MKTKLIAFTGGIGSGKSTDANYLCGKVNGIRLNFKDALIQEVKKRFPYLLQVILSVVEPNYTTGNFSGISDVDTLLTRVPRPKLIRTLLQNYGTDVRRKDNSLYWVMLYHRKYNEIRYAYPHSVITTDDCRFPNESTRICQLGGKVIRIIRNNKNQNNAHLSELAMSKIVPYANIDNDTTLTELYEKIDQLISRY